MEDRCVSQRLTSFATDIRYDELPREVVEFIKLCIVDQFGVQLGLSQRPVSRVALNYASSFGEGCSTIMGTNRTAPPEFAAFANGVFGHAFELDDLHMPSLNHPGPMVVAPAFAMGEALRINGKAMIEAVAGGYEVMGRIGRGLGRDYVYGRGFHPVGVLGPIGAAMAAGKIMSLRQPQMLHALGLATSHGAGTIEYNQTWGETTRLHAGLAAMGGIRSATLARAGMTGPGAPIAGKYGFARVHSDQCEFDAMVEDLGKSYILMFNRFKLRPYHGILHAVIDNALGCLDEVQLAPGTDALQAIKSVAVGLSSAAMRGLAEGDDGDAGFESSTHAQFSLHGPLANAIAYGGTIESVWNFDRHDPLVVALEPRISAYFDEACEVEWYRDQGQGGAKIFVRVTIELTDGQTREVFGAPFEVPRTRARMDAKFIELAARVIPEPQARELLDTLGDLELIDDVNALRRLVQSA